MANRGAKRRGKALLVFLVCGIVGVGIDLDHVLVLLVRGIPITWENLARHAGRPLHIPVLVVACAGSIVSGALLVRRAFIT